MQVWKNESAEGLRESQINVLCLRALEGRALGKVLLIVPDITRYYSNAGTITRLYYRHSTWVYRWIY